MKMQDFLWLFGPLPVEDCCSSYASFKALAICADLDIGAVPCPFPD